MQVEIQPLSSTHNRNEFDCGIQELNAWFARMASQLQEKRRATVFVAVDTAEPAVPLGYYALSASKVDGGDLPLKNVPREVPAVLLGRLAIATHLQGKGLGKLVLMSALEKAALAAQTIGVMVVAVNAKDQKAADFYSRYGFQPAKSDPLLMFLPVDTIKNLL